MHYIISPHYDDMTGCAGLIQRLRARGREVAVVNVFGRVLCDSQPDRMAEDTAACGVLGCRTTHLDFSDEYDIKDGKHVRKSAPHDGLMEEIRAALGTIFRRGDTALFPAGLGNNPDHVAVCEAGKKLALDGKANVAFYGEDGYDLWAKDASKVAGFYKLYLRPEDLSRKILAARQYKSQIPLTYGSEGKMVWYYRIYHTENGRGFELYSEDAEGMT